MKFYYIGLERYKILGQMLATYLNMDMIHILNEWNLIYDIKKEDIVYCHYFQPDELEGKCNIICPKLDIARKWDSKIYQYDNLRDIVMTPFYTTHNSYIELVRALRKDNRPSFITLPYGNTGYTSIIYRPGDRVSKIAEKLEIDVDAETQIRVSEYIDKDFCVSIHLVIASEDDIYISKAIRQKIGDDGVTFKGGEYPSGLTKAQDFRVWLYTQKIGKFLAKDGYKGMIGVDYMIKDNQVIFCELNPRKMGTTVGVSMVMELEYHTSIPIIEYEAIINGKIPKMKKYCSYDMGWYLNMDQHPPEYKEKPGDEKKVFYTPGTVKYVDEYYCEFGTYRLEEK
jgi:hypothetical protein